MQRDDPGEAEDRFAEPAKAEQQQERADERLERVLGYDRDDGHPEERDDHGQGRGRGDRSVERRAPTSGDADREDDRRRLDELDRTRDERRQGRDGEGPNVHSATPSRCRRPAAG